MKVRSFAELGLLFILLSSEAIAQQYQYQVQDLGETQAVSINDSSQIVARNDSRQMLIMNTLITRLIDDPREIFANKINNYGEIAGAVVDGDSFTGFIFTPTIPNGFSGVFTSLPESVSSINDLGQTEMGIVPGGMEINNSGEIAGFVGTIGHGCAEPPTGNAFYYAQGVTTIIPTLGGRLAGTNGINNLGQVIGYSGVIDRPPCFGGPRLTAGFIWSDGNLTPILPTGPYTYASANDINDHGVVVGDFSGGGPSDPPLPFIYTEASGPVDLNSLADLPSGIRITNASKINNCGQILSSGVLSDGITQHRLLLTPARTGMVFTPDPITVSGAEVFTDNEDADADELTSQRKCVKLEGLVANGYLDGEYATTFLTESRLHEPNLVFHYTRSQPGFEEVMAYYHTHQVARYVHSIGFPELRTQPLAINVRAFSIDNSRFVYPNKLEFGTGGVDDAEDAAVIWHENGHAIINEIVPGWGDGPEPMAIGEGFGDYLGASAFAGSGPRGHEHDRDVLHAPWNSTSLPSQRVLNSDKHYPEDFVGERHLDGEMWSRCLWDIRNLVGRETADKLAIHAFEDMSSASSFRRISRNLLDQNLDEFAGAYQNEIAEIFTRRGILARMTAFTLNPAKVYGSRPVTVRIFFTSKAPIDGGTIRLSTTNPAAVVPPTVAIPSRAMSIQFTINTTPVASRTTGDIIAIWDDQTISTPLTVLPLVSVSATHLISCPGPSC